MTTLIMKLTARVLVPGMFVLAAYLLWRGHDLPGGGFIAGLVAGLAIAFRSFAFGRTGGWLRSFGTWPLVGVGLLIAVATGAGGWLWADAFLATGSVEGHLPVVGKVSLSTALLFELGLALVVVAVVVAVIDELGGAEQ